MRRGAVTATQFQRTPSGAITVLDVVDQLTASPSNTSGFKHLHCLTAQREGIHTAHAAHCHQRRSGLAHHLVGHRCAVQQRPVFIENCEQVSHSGATVGFQPIAICHHERISSLFELLCQIRKSHRYEFCLSCSVNLSIFCISSGMRMRCGQCDTHCPHPMQWLA